MSNATRREMKACCRYVMAIFAVACHVPMGTRTTSDTTRLREFREYAARDSVVIDSLARLVNTDSLYRLNRRLLDTTVTIKPLVQEILCERRRIVRANGFRPAEIALRRLMDTVWTRDERKRVRIDERMPSAGFIEVSERMCGPFPPGSPSTVNGFSLFNEPVYSIWDSVTARSATDHPSPVIPTRDGPPVTAVSSAQAIISFFRESPQSRAGWIAGILAQDGSPEPEAKLDSIADALEAIALGVSAGETDRSRTVEANSVLSAFTDAGARGRGVNAYPGAYDRLRRIHEHAQHLGIRRQAVYLLIRVGDHQRGIAYLRTVASSTDATAQRAINGLISDAIGFASGTASERARAALRELYDSHAVSDWLASRDLRMYAEQQAWIRK